MGVFLFLSPLPQPAVVAFDSLRAPQSPMMCCARLRRRGHSTMRRMGGHAVLRPTRSLARALPFALHEPLLQLQGVRRWRRRRVPLLPRHHRLQSLRRPPQPTRRATVRRRMSTMGPQTCLWCSDMSTIPSSLMATSLTFVFMCCAPLLSLLRFSFTMRGWCGSPRTPTLLLLLLRRRGMAPPQIAASEEALERAAEGSEQLGTSMTWLGTLRITASTRRCASMCVRTATVPTGGGATTRCTTAVPRRRRPRWVPAGGGWPRSGRSTNCAAILITNGKLI